jgi:hypothetical protein
MPTFVSAQYVVNEAPPPEMLIRAVDEDGTIWWLQDGCMQGDWLAFVDEGGTVRAAGEADPAATEAAVEKPKPKRRKK